MGAFGSARRVRRPRMPVPRLTCNRTISARRRRIYFDRRVTPMARLSLYLIGIAAGVAAIVTYRDRKNPDRRMPVRKAAAMLQEAWADHHTRA